MHVVMAGRPVRGAIRKRSGARSTGLLKIAGAGLLKRIHEAVPDPGVTEWRDIETEAPATPPGAFAAGLDALDTAPYGVIRMSLTQRAYRNAFARRMRLAHQEFSVGRCW
jgi:hypothetical protein